MGTFISYYVVLIPCCVVLTLCRVCVILRRSYLVSCLCQVRKIDATNVVSCCSYLVSCLCQVRKIDAAKYRKVHEEVMKKLDKLENEFLPQVMVDNTEIILETVSTTSGSSRVEIGSPVCVDFPGTRKDR